MDKESIISLINNSIKEGIHVIDSKARTLLYNSTMADFEGMKIDAVLNKQLLEVLPSLQGKSTLIKVLETGKSITMNHQTYFNKDGKQISTVNSTWPIKKGRKIIGAVEIAKDVTIIERTVNSLLSSNQILNKNDTKENHKFAKYTLDDILGNSPEILNAKQITNMASKTDSSVLIIGESGTGKELFAQSIHNASKRSHKPFIAENCAAMPESLLEGLLFGTTKGGFTGAVDRAGLLQQANGGTLLLDEINSMPLGLQAKLLRVLQESKFRPIGSTKEIKVDVRIVAITNKEPFKLIEDRMLREDLFFRLSVVNLYIPPLRNRKGDLDILKNHFIKSLEKKLNKTISGIDNKVLEFFNKYSWPGNVRELQHLLEGALNIIEDKGVINIEHLPYYMKRHFYNQGNNLDLNANLENINLDFSKDMDKLCITDISENNEMTLSKYIKQIEKELIEKAMEKENHNITRAAQSLGITRQNLQYKLKKS